ncbi:unnamed protein product [Nesidiocoris tenuis]|uniref:Uncharacterized protein n=1 Tax=Nesidiocoris tenuis TaxID=355587 RepID=A0A6H5FUZ2_9HEMI|nr:unnamed protein product [Nesidiocoris tenuis]
MVITSLGPAKPQRSSNENNNSSLIGPEMLEHDHLLAGSSRGNPTTKVAKVCFETSFTATSESAGGVCRGISSGSLASLLYAAAANQHQPPDYLSSPLSGDWCGLAPLAAQESLSDLSTIGPSIRFDDDVTRVSCSSRSSTSSSDSLTREIDRRRRFFSRLFCKKDSSSPRRDRTTSCPVEVLPLRLSNVDIVATHSQPVGSSSESSPLLSSLHILKDSHFLTSTTSGPDERSPDDRSPDDRSFELVSPASLGAGSLLEDIERSLGVCLSRPASAELPPPGTPILYPINDPYSKRKRCKNLQGIQQAQTSGANVNMT